MNLFKTSIRALSLELIVQS